MRYPFDSPEAKELNIQIFETMYYAALTASCELAQEEGPYETYEGSPISKGQLQHDMWGVTPTDLHDWSALKEKIARSVSEETKKVPEIIFKMCDCLLSC